MIRVFQFVVVLCLARAALAAPDPPIIRIPRTDTPPTLADFEDMQPSGRLAGKMVKISGFVAREPSDGAKPSQDTDVYLAYDSRNLYAIFVCWDSEAKKIRARMTRREDFSSDDSAGILIDTFHDARRGYAFAANPLGIQWDALWTEGTSRFDDSFDTVWNSEGRLTGRGYLVLLAIPFKSLRFPASGQQTWGIILSRSIPRTNEDLHWPRVSSRIEGRLNQAATVTGIDRISPGRNLQFNPYSGIRTFRAIDQRDPNRPVFTGRAFKPDTGLDAKFILRDSFVLDATVNPDFSQVESDQPQITVNQRFEVFFPEKRPFFLENSNYFATPIDLVFTRRIAHPEYGLRLTGKSGPWALGVMASDDRAPGEVVAPGDPLAGERATFTIARVSRDIFDQSNIGVLFTDREFAGTHNRVGGVDANLKLNQNWRLQGQAVESNTTNLDGTSQSGAGYKLDLKRSGRQFTVGSTYTDFAPGFNTKTGFVNRADIRETSADVRYYFRPEGKFLISWGPELEGTAMWDHGGTALEHSFMPSIGATMKRNTSIWFVPYFRDDVFLRPRDFSGLSGVTSYPLSLSAVEASTSWFKQFDLEWFYISGDGVNYNPARGHTPVIGHEEQSAFNLSFHARGRLRIDNKYLLEHFRGREPRLTAVTNHIARSNWNYQFTKEFSARIILQYTAVLSNPLVSSLSPTKDFNVDFLITYLVHPGTAVYVGYNSDLENLDRRLLPGPDGLLTTRNNFVNDGRQFFIKLSYLFRP